MHIFCFPCFQAFHLFSKLQLDAWCAVRYSGGLFDIDIEIPAEYPCPVLGSQRIPFFLLGTVVTPVVTPVVFGCPEFGDILIPLYRYLLNPSVEIGKDFEPLPQFVKTLHSAVFPQAAILFYPALRLPPKP